MNSKLLLIILFSSTIMFSACQFDSSPRDDLTQTQTPVPITPVNEISDSQVKEFSEFTARFEIYTKGTKRIFTLPMYHNQSTDVYIESDNPSLIQVKKEGVTWNDFFQTLPFSLTKECLITGTKQQFCSDENGKLRFVLNGVEEPNSLDIPILKDDLLVVEYINK